MNWRDEIQKATVTYLREHLCAHCNEPITINQIRVSERIPSATTPSSQYFHAACYRAYAGLVKRPLLENLPVTQAYRDLLEWAKEQN